MCVIIVAHIHYFKIRQMRPFLGSYERFNKLQGFFSKISLFLAESLPWEWDFKCYHSYFIFSKAWHCAVEPLRRNVTFSFSFGSVSFKRGKEIPKVETHSRRYTQSLTANTHRTVPVFYFRQRWGGSPYSHPRSSRKWSPCLGNSRVL